MAQHKLTDGQKREILHRWIRYEDSAKDLAADYDVSPERIYQIVRAAKVPMHQPHDDGDFSNNGRKVVEPQSSLTLDYLLSRMGMA